ncbi:ECF transporter S component [Lagierella sp.]|uniref:ECF transporter S component n=1 Tax=Lagierella sp. TaxID=2849657 RepID=UPI00261E0219|nr:ECF transporter S component [Lagierella sp.]
MKKFTTRDLTILALLSAITVVFGLTPLGYIPLGLIRVTTLHIPTIIGAIICGPFIGGLVGLVFGLFSLFTNLTAPSSLLYFMFINPLVSVLPRVLIGVLTGLLFKKLNEKFKDNFFVPFIVGACGAVINTVLVLGLGYLLYGQRIAEIYKVANAGKILIGIAASNLPFEMLATSVIVGFVTRPLRKSLDKKRM